MAERLTADEIRAAANHHPNVIQEVKDFVDEWEDFYGYDGDLPAHWAIRGRIEKLREILGHPREENEDAAQEAD